MQSRAHDAASCWFSLPINAAGPARDTWHDADGSRPRHLARSAEPCLPPPHASPRQHPDRFCLSLEAELEQQAAASGSRSTELAICRPRLGRRGPSGRRRHHPPAQTIHHTSRSLMARPFRRASKHSAHPRLPPPTQRGEQRACDTQRRTGARCLRIPLATHSTACAASAQPYGCQCTRCQCVPATPCLPLRLFTVTANTTTHPRPREREGAGAHARGTRQMRRQYAPLLAARLVRGRRPRQWERADGHRQHTHLGGRGEAGEDALALQSALHSAAREDIDAPPRCSLPLLRARCRERLVGVLLERALQRHPARVALPCALALARRPALVAPSFLLHLPVPA